MGKGCYGLRGGAIFRLELGCDERRGASPLNAARAFAHDHPTNMTTPNRSRFRLAAISLLLAFAATALFPVRALAQSSGTGTIQGRVYNPASKEYVKDAEVRLDGTNQLTYSTQDGSFEFIGVPAGSASITVNYSGYSEARESFNVGANRTAVREVNLVSTVASPGTTGKDGVVKLEAFQVSSAREGNSKAAEIALPDAPGLEAASRCPGRLRRANA